MAVQIVTNQLFSDFSLTTTTAAHKMVKIKRYFGKPYNVSQNIFFEQYMDSVAKCKFEYAS